MHTEHITHVQSLILVYRDKEWKGTEYYIAGKVGMKLKLEVGFSTTKVESMHQMYLYMWLILEKLPVSHKYKYLEMHI